MAKANPQSSSDFDAPQKRGCGCFTYGLLLGIGIPVLLLIIAALIFTARERAARSELNARLDELQAQGLPFDDASMQSYHESLTSSQDTEQWLAILAEITSDEFNASTAGVHVFDGMIESDVPPPITKVKVASSDGSANSDSSEQYDGSQQAGDQPGETSRVVGDDEWPEEQATRDFLQRWRRLHSDIMRASMRQLRDDAQPVRFPIQFDSINTQLQNTQNMRQAARLLSLQGQVAVRDRDSAGTRRDIEALFGASNTLAGEPVLVSQLVHIAIDGMGLQLLKSALEYDVLNEKDLESILEHVVKRTSIGSQWNKAMVGERAMMLPIFQNPSRAGQQSLSSVAIPARSRDALYYINAIEAASAVNSEDIDEFRTQLAEQEKKLQALTSGGLLTRLDSILTSMMSPALEAGGNAFVRKVTMQRLAALSIGVRIFEKRNQRLPSSLDELSTLGLDASVLKPAGGSPFGYSTTAEGAALWGYDLNIEKAVPATLPIIEDTEPYADSRRQWIWKLRSIEPEND